MKASETTILKLLESVRQFYIPVYQRPYSWRLTQCRQLWQDILRVGNLPESGHFVGAVVTVSEGLGTAIAPVPLIVIDGQQRLITVMLLLEALARHLIVPKPARYACYEMCEKFWTQPYSDIEVFL